MSTRGAKRTANKSRTTPAGFRHNMGPLFVGMAAAEFLPADPMVWLEVAARAGMRVALLNGRMSMVWEHADSEEKDFLLGWLAGTPDSKEAIHALLVKRQG